MGILSDLFVATPEQAARYAERISELDNGDAITKLLKPLQLKSFTGLEMGTLWAILEGVTWNVDKHMLEDVQNDQCSGLWRFPHELTRLLACANMAAMESACLAWADTDELQCSPSELLPVLRGIQALAVRASREGNSLYLWVSL
jgi:hypothetical protein